MREPDTLETPSNVLPEQVNFSFLKKLTLSAF